MNRTARLAVLSIAALLLTAAGARAAVIDFQSLESTQSVRVPNPYVEDGFQLSTQGRSFLATTGTDSATFYAGSTGVFLFPGGSMDITLTKADGGAFSLTSIDLSSWGNAPSFSDYRPITFRGTTTTGDTVTQDITPVGFGYTAFAFDATFTDLVSVVWQQGNSDLRSHQFDNIVVSAVATPVPEPTTLLLFGTALFGLAARLRSRQA